MHEGLNNGVAALAGVTLVFWSLFAARFEKWNLTGPICFVAVGMLLANGPLAIIDLGISSEGLRQLAEFALAVVLFGDAATVKWQELRSDAGLPTRLLGLGLPLTMALGTLTAHWLLPGASWWVSAVVGAAVAPTDAALGAAIINDERVPERVRLLLNVESGLNDGIATPFVTFFLVAAVAGSAAGKMSPAHALAELGIGVIAGGALGWTAGWAMNESHRSALSTSGVRSVGTAALAVVAYAGVVELGGNGFVAAFIAGLAYGAVIKEEARTLRFTREAGEVLSLTVWFVFGALVVPVLSHAGWREVAFGLAALTVVRMAPVALSLSGTRLDLATVGIIGWFGPRGLASVVFGLLAAQGLGVEGQPALTAIAVTVMASVILHGASAGPLAERYGAARAASDRSG